jgi:H+/Cl- antiporter ClcA
MGPLLAFAEPVTTTNELSGAEAGVAIGVIIFAVVIGLVYLAWYIWLILDMNKYPEGAWVSSAQNKQLWVILWFVGLCIGGGLIIGLIYQLAIRPKVRQAAGVV